MMSSPPRPAFDELPQSVAVLRRDYPAGAETGLHHHRRGQLLHAIDGLMIVSTMNGRWAVPTGHAVWIPPHVSHEVRMHGAVAMRSAYIAAAAAAGLPGTCRVLPVSPLLRAAILAILDEPLQYDERGRGGHLAALVIDEIARGAEAPLALPLPHDRRLRALAETLLQNPSLTLGLDAWAERIGMSRRSLTRRFRAETGLSFVTWRRRLRLMTAAVLVAEGTPVAKAGREVGYRGAGVRALLRRQSNNRPPTDRPSSDGDAAALVRSPPSDNAEAGEAGNASATGGLAIRPRRTSTGR